MANDILSEAKNSASQLGSVWRSLQEDLNGITAEDGSTFDLDATIPNTKLSIRDLGIQIQFLEGEVDALAPATDDAVHAALPPLAPAKLTQCLDQAWNAVTKAQELLSQTINNIDNTTLKATSPASQTGTQARRQNAQTLDFGSRFKEAVDALDEAMARLLQLKQMHPTDGAAGAFSGLIGRLKELAQSAEERTREIEHHESTARGNATKSVEHKDSASGAAEAADESRQSVESSREEVETKKGEIESNHGFIKEVAQEAKNLRATVNQHQADFEALQEALDDHKNQLKRGAEEKDRLIAELSEIEKRIQEKESQAATMLGNATNAGLAHEFKSTRDALDAELKEARKLFYWSMVSLVLLASPMLLYITPWIGGPALGADADWSARLTEVAVRAAVLLPGIWFAGFASRRHNHLFRLREQYQYKYNIAASVHGFKQQAEDLSSAIAGTTFYELLTRNPADAMEGARKEENPTAENPLSKLVRDYLVRRSDGEK